MTPISNFNIQDVDFAKYQDGLAPIIVQNYYTREVLMLGFANSDALEKSLESGLLTFYSRTKNRLWTKGEESGNVLSIVKLYLDCDRDSILAEVIPKGNTCHTGTRSCFGSVSGILHSLETLINGYKSCEIVREGSYTTSLIARGINKISQKVGEEGVEVALAGVIGDKGEILYESADLVYHLLILLSASDLKFEDVLKELEKRS